MVQIGGSYRIILRVTLKFGLYAKKGARRLLVDCLVGAYAGGRLMVGPDYGALGRHAACAASALGVGGLVPLS